MIPLDIPPAAVTLPKKTGRENMATTVAAAPIGMDAFIEKQARGDAVVNIVLAGGINYWLTRDLGTSINLMI